MIIKKKNPALENNLKVCKLISTVSGAASEAQGAPEINPQTRTHDWALPLGRSLNVLSLKS